MYRSLLLLFLFLLFVAFNDATPDCCNLSFDCLNNQRASTGEYEIGTSLDPTERDRCTLQGRANWCVAKYEDDLWYCTSPGNFIEYLNGYKGQCKGGVFPTNDKKEPCCRYEGGTQTKCNIALRKLKNLKC